MLVTLAIVMAGIAAPSIAVAQPVNPIGTRRVESEVAHVRQLLQAAEAQIPQATLTLRSFGRASRENQARFAEAYLHPAKMVSALRSAKVSTTIEQSSLPSVEALTAGTWTQWQRTVVFNVGVFGIDWMSIRMGFGWYYNGSHVGTYWCQGWISGFTGAMTLDVSSLHSWYDSRYAHCEFNVTASVLYKGFGGVNTKEFHAWGDKYGRLWDYGQNI